MAHFTKGRYSAPEIEELREMHTRRKQQVQSPIGELKTAISDLTIGEFVEFDKKYTTAIRQHLQRAMRASALGVKYSVLRHGKTSRAVRLK